MITKCKGLVGEIFGHKFARYETSKSGYSGDEISDMFEATSDAAHRSGTYGIEAKVIQDFSNIVNSLNKDHKIEAIVVCERCGCKPGDV